MENLFLNVVESISASRFWLGPILVICIWVMAGKLIIDAFRDIQAEMNGEDN